MRRATGATTATTTTDATVTAMAPGGWAQKPAT